MPMIKYACTRSECGLAFSVLFKLASEAPNMVSCKKCKGEAKRKLGNLNQTSLITIDNGAQARAVEVRPDIMDLRHERAYKPPNRGD